MGQTATNLRKVFDFIEAGKFVVLFDGFDMAGKKRSDPHELGEIKRAVSSFVQMLDRHDGSGIMLTAADHRRLLDKAVWRRFDDAIYFDLPDGPRRRRLFEKCPRVMRREAGIDPNRLAGITPGYSAAGMAQTCAKALKRGILDDSRIVLQDHITRATGSRGGG